MYISWYSSLDSIELVDIPIGCIPIASTPIHPLDFKYSAVHTVLISTCPQSIHISCVSSASSFISRSVRVSQSIFL